MDTIARPYIGQSCLIQAQAFKVYSWPEKFREYKRNKYPHTSRWIAQSLSQPETMKYIGYRVVGEGITYLRYDDDGHGGYGFNYPEYQQKCTHTLWLFVRSERSNPIYVFPSDVKFFGVVQDE